jgi:hypothetical protein
MMENLGIRISKLKDRTIVWHQAFLFVNMALCPFIKDNFFDENLALKNRFDRNVLVDQLGEIILKQV